MSETPNRGLSQEHDLEAKRLYASHKQHGKSVEWAQETLDDGDEMRKKVEEARENGTEEDIPYQDRVFANGEITQRRALSSAEMLHNANMWEARKHKEEHLEEYREQARMEAEAEETTINLSEEEK